ncbi:MAG: tetratricopeptide repeat protein [Armatimonadetes bacterium]|nr:tetratricopeptide repeat protein [Armatimonadota bacterium]
MKEKDTRLAEDQKPIRIEAFGGLRAVLPDRVLTHFQTQKTGTLLGMLATRIGTNFQREELAEALWPEAPLDISRHRLNQAVSWLRRNLEPTPDLAGKVIRSDLRTLTLLPTCIQTDTAEFEHNMAYAIHATETPERLTYLEAACRGYQGKLLVGFAKGWLLSEQERFQDLFGSALTDWVALLVELGRQDEALAVAELALRDPELAPLHRELRGLATGQVVPIASPVPLSEHSGIPRVPAEDGDGRADELNRILKAYEDRERGVIITGPVGIGKTWLLLRAQSLFSNAGVQIALDPAEATSRSVVIIDREESMDDLELEKLSAVLASRDAFLLAVMPALPHPIGFVEVALGGLRLPDVPTLASVRSHPASALLLRRLSLLRPDARVDDEVAAPIYEICRRVGGNPQVLELISSWFKFWPAAEVLNRLESQELLLELERPDLPDSIRRMRAAVDSAIAMTDPVDLELLVQLTVFPGTFSMEAAGLLSTVEAIPSRLRRLIQVGLVEIEERPGEARTLMRIPRLTVEAIYGQIAPDHAALTKNQLARRLRERLEQIERTHDHDGRVKAWLQLNREADTIQTALNWLAQTGQAEQAAEIICLLVPHWSLTGRPEVGLAWLDRMPAKSPTVQMKARIARADLLLEAGMMNAAIQLYDDIRRNDQPSARDLVMALCRESLALRKKGRLDQAAEVAQAAILIAEQKGYRCRVIHCLCKVAAVHALRGRIHRAERDLERALSLARKLDSKVLEALVLGHLGRCYLMQDMPDQAEEVLELGIGVMGELVGDTFLSSMFSNLSWTKRLLGKPDDAYAAYLGGSSMVRSAIVELEWMCEAAHHLAAREAWAAAGSAIGVYDARMSAMGLTTGSIRSSCMHKLRTLVSERLGAEAESAFRRGRTMHEDEVHVLLVDPLGFHQISPSTSGVGDSTVSRT